MTSPEWCVTCQNTGEISCKCGGEECACGEIAFPCPDCTDEYDELLTLDELKEFV